MAANGGFILAFQSQNDLLLAVVLRIILGNEDSQTPKLLSHLIRSEQDHAV